MPNEKPGSTSPQLVPTGIPGLDTILRGGLLEGGAYILRGTPGIGKTILANHASFHHVRQGGRVLYVTVIAESAARMLQHIGRLGFFDASAMPASLYYVSAFPIFEEKGLPGVIDMILQEAMSHAASLIVIDGLLELSEPSQSDQEFRKFINRLQTLVANTGALALLTASESRPRSHPAYTMVDGIIFLERVLIGARLQRQIEIEKMRGSAFLAGKHSFEITDDGIVVHPRFETVYAHPSSEDRSRNARTPIGIAKLDAMVGGGLPSGTTTLLLGPSGAGKTVIGLQFTCHATAEAPALLFTFYETPPRLRMKAKALNLEFDKCIERGNLEVIWEPPAENMLDALGERLLAAVERRKVKRLFIDGLGGFQEASVYPDRLVHFFSSLMNELRIRDVTTIYTGETQVIIGSEVRSPINGLSIIAENIVLLRYVELRSTLYRMLSVLKIRDSDFDARLHEFQITSGGMDLAPTSGSAEAILADLGSKTVRQLLSDKPTARAPRKSARRPRE